MSYYEYTDAIETARPFVGDYVALQVGNFAFEQLLTVTKYWPTQDVWQLSDGEIYTTNQILREVEHG